MSATGPAPARSRGRRGRPRDAQAEQAILEAAVSILAEAGFGGLSIEAVAARAGVGRPTVYRRWPSKLDLAIDAVVRLAPPMPAAGDGEPRDELRQLVPQLMADMTRSPVGRAMIAVASDAEAHAALARRLDEHYLTPRRAIISDILRRGVADGSLRPDIDLDLAIDLMVGAATYRWLVTGQPVDAAGAQRIVDAVWQSLRPSGP